MVEEGERRGIWWLWREVSLGTWGLWDLGLSLSGIWEYRVNENVRRNLGKSIRRAFSEGTQIFFNICW